MHSNVAHEHIPGAFIVHQSGNSKNVIKPCTQTYTLKGLSSDGVLDIAAFIVQVNEEVVLKEKKILVKVKYSNIHQKNDTTKQ